MPSFEQLEMYFSSIDAAAPATSAQATWIAGAAEARELAAELSKNLAELKHYWSGPAANEYYAAMNAIIEFANGLADDMANMSAGLSSMASMAASIQPQALSIIAAARPHAYSRAAAIAPLTGLLQQLGGTYESDKGQYWHEPTQPPQRLPKASDDQDSTPSQVEVPDDVRPSPILGAIDDIGKYIGLAGQAWDAYQAFNEDRFPSGVTGSFPGGSFPGWDGGIGDGPSLPGGGGPGGIGGGDGPGGTGPGGWPNDPDYQPLPEPSQDLTDSPVHLAGAGPTNFSAGSPAVSLAVNNGGGMGSPGGGPMPMGMGMGAAGMASGSSKPSSTPSRPAGGSGGMFGPPMAGGRRNESQKDEEGVRTWLTEDELAWDSEPAPGGIVGK